MPNESAIGERTRDAEITLRIVRGQPTAEELVVLLLALRALRANAETTSLRAAALPVPRWRRAVQYASSVAHYRGSSSYTRRGTN
jgi:hypothetical protein